MLVWVFVCLVGDLDLEWIGSDDAFAPYETAVVLYDMRSERFYRFNPSRGDQPLSPCSTFKIFNTLVGLESGVLKDASTSFKWHGKRHWIESWNRDHDLASAFRYSVVWYYQELARRIGADTMQASLDAAGYGNRDMSGGLDRFWLNSSLTITAEQQVRFITDLYRGHLPFSEHSQDITRTLMLRDSGPGFEFSGKTGSSMREGEFVLGWFVGHLASEHGEWSYAIHITGKGAKGYLAQKLMRKILDRLELI